MNTTKKYGLIGFPLGHSFSQKYFTDKFKRENINAEYTPYPIEHITDFPAIIEKVKNLKGLNVTIPYKESVMKYLSELSDDVKKIGAVNVIKISDNDQERNLKGYNTDFIGFRDSLKPLLREDIKKALILGTGGASKAVAYALEDLGISATKVSRNPSECELSYQQLTDEVMKENLLIVNTTPLGMYPKVDTFPPIPYSLLTRKHICYDLVYNPEVTKFMQKAADMGAIVKNGLDMLHLQAEAAWRIWQL